MSGRRLEFTARARRDIRSLLRYSLETCGAKSRDEYARALDEATLHLVDYPEMGYARPDLFTGARALTVEHHIVYYRVESGTIRIVRVLHEKSDAKRMFKRLTQE